MAMESGSLPKVTPTKDNGCSIDSKVKEFIGTKIVFIKGSLYRL